MNYIGTINLETNRLILRRFNIDDMVPLYNNWACDSDVVKYMRMKPHENILETQQFIESIICNYQKPDTFRWIIILKEINEPIGFIGLTTINEHDMTGDFGYSIGKSYWNNGYTTEALRAVLDFGLKVIGYNRLEAYHSINNMSSGRVMIKAGMTYEGRAKSKYRSNIGFEDCDMYSILKADIL